MDYSEIRFVDVPFPVENKIDEDRIYYKHPDYPHWISGYALGDDYTLEAIQTQIERTPIPTHPRRSEPER